jgi:transposase
MRHKRAGKGGAAPSLQCIEPDAAGIDVGATEIYVAVPPDRDPNPVRCFTTFTEDLQALAAWLLACRIRTVAMESTGVYWIPVFQVLEARGLKVCLVNSQHVKHVPGRKSDVADCQWLQYLHTVGLLRGSFRPEDAICQVRSLLQHMQKALSQMNLQLHHVLSDLTGQSGMAILDAILGGERNPQVLAELRDGRVKASPEAIVKSLVGDYRREHLFTLRQSLQAYRHYQTLMAACDLEIAEYLKEFDSKIDVDQHPLPPERYPHPRRKNEFHFDMRTELYRILGVDLTAVPGLNALTAHTLLAEVGRDLSRFPSAAAFVSWLGLCPQNKKSGGKILSTKTRRTKNRLNCALRVAAQTLHRSQTHLGVYYRRMRTRLGAPKAITAAAHKLARIIFHLLTTGQSYDESIFAVHEQRRRTHMENRLRRQANEFGFQLVALPA